MEALEKELIDLNGLPGLIIRSQAGTNLVGLRRLHRHQKLMQM
jgi:hypothetical protein